MDPKILGWGTERIFSFLFSLRLHFIFPTFWASLIIFPNPVHLRHPMCSLTSTCKSQRRSTAGLSLLNIITHNWGVHSCSWLSSQKPRLIRRFLRMKFYQTLEQAILHYYILRAVPLLPLTVTFWLIFHHLSYLLFLVPPEFWTVIHTCYLHVSVLVWLTV